MIMCHLYICDNDAGRVCNARRWGQILGELQYEIVVWSQCQFRLTLEGDGIASGPGLVIVHPHRNSVVAQRMADFAENNNLWIVFISGGPTTTTSTHRRCYYRKAYVNKPEDDRFGHYVKRFLDDLTSRKTATLSLLEPDAWPEHLVAAALLLGGLRHGNASGAIRSEWAKIEEAWRMSFLDSVAKEFAEHKGGRDLWESVGLKKEEAGLCLAQIDKTECLDQAFDVIRSALPQRPSTTY